MKASNKSRFFIILAVVILAIAAIILVYELTAPKEINFSGSGDSLESWLFNGKTSGGSDVTITGLYVDGAYSVKIRLKGVRGYSYFANIPNRATLPDILNEWAEYARNNGRADIADYIKTIPVSYNDPSSGSVLSSILVPILLYAVLAIVFIIILRKSMGANSQAMNFGKTTANQVRDIKVRFNDVAGAEEEKQELQEIVDFLKYPKKYTDIGARIPRGVLLPERVKRSLPRLLRARRTFRSFR